MLKHQFEEMAGLLHSDIVLISPLDTISGISAVVDAAQKLMKLVSDIKIRAKFSSKNQIMLAYDFFFPEPIGILRASVLMDFRDNLINRIELFYDARPFAGIKSTIFSGQES